MRRALALIGLIGLGVLLGFAFRLVWPRRDRLSLDAYSAPVGPATWPADPVTEDVPRPQG